MHLGDVDRRAPAAQPRDQVDGQVLPGRDPACGDDPSILAAEREHVLGAQVHRREMAPIGVAVRPVRCRVVAVQQSRVREQQRSRAHRGDERTFGVDATDEADLVGIAAAR